MSVDSVARSNLLDTRSGAGSLADRVLDIARSNLGFREGAGNVNPFSRFFGRPAEAWCADFVSYCFTKAGKPLNFANTDAMMNHLKKQGAWHTGTPKPGDIVLFDWNRGDRDPSEHVGMVEKVYKKGGQTFVQTIEGNSSNQVKRNTYPLGSNKIVGYGTLDGKPTSGPVDPAGPTGPSGPSGPSSPGHSGGSSFGHPTLRRGSRGEAVEQMQRMLKAAGFNPGPLDGIFGPKTQAAVKAFQQAKGIGVDGIVGPQTWGKLDGGGLREGSRGPAVTDLQNQLKAAGFDPGPIDGIFGPKTEAAVKAYQQAKGLEVDGIVGPKTRGALKGGGSQPGQKPGGTTGPGEVDRAPPPGDVKGGVSLGELRKIMPHLSEAKAKQYLPSLNKAMVDAGINTPKRQAAFLAQLAHESGEFRYMEEIASGRAYEGRKDLGNTQPGDGMRYKGRGPIQLTGRANYRAAGKALGIDLEGNPERAKDPDVAFRVAAWFWNSRSLSKYADSGNFDTITRRINGGFNGKASRDAYYARAKDVLGA
jgi:putative chitinase